MLLLRRRRRLLLLIPRLRYRPLVPWNARLKARPDQIVKKTAVRPGPVVNTLHNIAWRFRHRRTSGVGASGRVRRSGYVNPVAVSLLYHRRVSLLLLQSTHPLRSEVLFRQDRHVWCAAHKRRVHEGRRIPEVEGPERQMRHALHKRGHFQAVRAGYAARRREWFLRLQLRLLIDTGSARPHRRGCRCRRSRRRRGLFRLVVRLLLVPVEERRIL